MDITDLYNAWKNGTHPNFGVQLRLKLNGNANFNNFYSADSADDPAKAGTRGMRLLDSNIVI